MNGIELSLQKRIDQIACCRKGQHMLGLWNVVPTIRSGDIVAVLSEPSPEENQHSHNESTANPAPMLGHYRSHFKERGDSPITFEWFMFASCMHE